MKKVLILAYDFPPYNSVGAARPYSWFQNLKSFNVHPIIVTRNWKIKYGDARDYVIESDSSTTKIEENDFGTIIKTPYKTTLSNRLYLKFGEKLKLFRKILTGGQEIIQHITFKGPKHHLYTEAKKFLATNKVDAIIATGDPYILFKYASALSKEFGIPWYADYRDDWIEGHTRSIDYKGLGRVFTYFERKRELLYLKNVIGIVSVSNYLVDQIKTRINCSKGVSIENGVDISLYAKNKNPFIDKTFNILYSGTLYDLPYLIDFKEAFISFMRKQENSKNIKLHFIGIENKKNQSTKIVHEILELFPDTIKLEKRKEAAEIAQYQCHANLLLNFIAGDPSKGLIGAKSYSYAAAKVPILTIPSVKNSNSPFFPNRDIQYVAVSASEIEAYLNKLYTQFQNNDSTSTSITDKELFDISQKSKTQELVNFILP
jgi:hypothetical protein